MAAGKMNSVDAENNEEIDDESASFSQTHTSCFIEESSEISMSTFDGVFMLLSFLTFVGDLLADVSVAIQYFTEGHVAWASLTTVFIVVPAVVLQIFSLRWFQNDNYQSKCTLWTIHLLLLGPVLRYILVLKTAMKAWKTKHEDDILSFYLQQNDVCILRLFESFLESAPQILLQLYIILNTPDGNWLTGISAAVSLISLAWAIAAYTNATRLAYQENYKVSYPGLMVLSLWRLFMLASRVIVLVIFTAAFKAWIFLILGFHWLLMFVWITLQRTDFCITWLEERLYNVIVAFIYCFCFFNVKDGETRWRVVGFYSLIIVENTILLISWFAVKNPLTWRVWSTVAGVYGTFVIGLICMLIYYRFCHPSLTAQVTLNKASGNERTLRGQTMISRNENAHRRCSGEVPCDCVCEDYLEPLQNCSLEPHCDPINLSAYYDENGVTKRPLILTTAKQFRKRKHSSRSRTSEEDFLEVEMQTFEGAVGGEDNSNDIDNQCSINTSTEFEETTLSHPSKSQESLNSNDTLEMQKICNAQFLENSTKQFQEDSHDSHKYFELEHEEIIPKIDLQDLLTYGAEKTNDPGDLDLSSSYVTCNPHDSLEELENLARYLASSSLIERHRSGDEYNTRSPETNPGASNHLIINKNNYENSSIDSNLEEKEQNMENSDLSLARDRFTTQQNHYIFI